MAFIKYTSGNVKIVKHNICCVCDSDEHQINLRYFEDDSDLLYMTIHLKSENNIFKRIYKAILYVFGHKSKYGNFDEVILDKEKCEEIINFLKK
jgi:hypothetical protein